jgi:hypothetical protein
LEEEQYKNEWEIGQLDYEFIKNVDDSELSDILDISSNCFQKH